MGENITIANITAEKSAVTKKTKVYDCCKNDDKIIPFVWRGAFLAKICNIQIPEDTEVVCMDENELRSISSEPYSNALAHLLVLYGAGYISYEQLSALSRYSEKYEDEILSAERFVIEQSEKDEKEQVSRDYIENILLCTIISKKYAEIQTVDFDMARQLCDGPYTTMRNGYVYVKDVGFYTLLANVGEKMGAFINNKLNILEKDRYIGDVNAEIINAKLNEKIETGDPYAPNVELPFLINLRTAYYIQELYNKPYAVEFINYAKAEGIPFDENFSKAFDEYVLNTKLKLSVSSIARKRSICGELVNWFDYGTTKYLDKKIVIDEKYDVTEEINLAEIIDKSIQLADDELINKAMDTFIDENEPADKTVIEVTFCGKKYVYLYDKEKNTKRHIDNEKFRKIPFDYNNVWTTVMEWSRSKLIQKKGDCIIVPDSEMAKIAKNDRIYAQRMIEEQYSLKKNGNRMLQKLSELKSYAKGEMTIKQQQAQLKAERETAVQEDKKNESVNS